MSNYVFEQNLRVYAVPTIASATLAAVTTAELAAGDELTEFITKDGFNPGVTNNRVPAGNLATAFDSEIQGSWGSSLSITFLRDDVDDAAWDLLGTRGVEIYIVAVPLGSGTGGAPAATDAAMVWAVETGSPTIPPSASNERVTFTADLAVSDANLHAAITAGA